MKRGVIMPTKQEISLIKTRRLTGRDLPQVMNVEASAWHVDWRAPRWKFEARMQQFPEGVIGAVHKGRVVGVSTSMPTNFDSESWSNPNMDWDTITAKGSIINHDPNGNALYVVSVAALQPKDYPPGEEKPRGVGTALVAAQIELAKSLNHEVMLLGSRLPGFKQWLEQQYQGEPLPIGDDLKEQARIYATLRDGTGRHVDPEQHFYQHNCDLEPIDPPGVKAHFGPDPDSLDFGFVVGKRLR